MLKIILLPGYFRMKHRLPSGNYVGGNSSILVYYMYFAAKIIAP